MMYKLLIVLTAVFAVALFAAPAKAGLEDTATAAAWSQVSIDPWWSSDESSSTPDKVIDDDSDTYWNSDWYALTGTTFTGQYGPLSTYPGWFELTWAVAVDTTGMTTTWNQSAPDHMLVYLNSTSEGGTDGTLVATGDGVASGWNPAWSSTSTTRLTIYLRKDDGAGGGLDQAGDVRFNEIDVAPEPATMALMGLGTLGTMLLRRRKSRK